MTGTATINKQPGHQDAIVSRPEHLRDDARFLVCSVCKRKEFCLDCDGERCGMPQPDGFPCGGVMVGTLTNRPGNFVAQSAKDRIRSVLIQMAAEMVRGKNMPSEFIEDWELPRTTPKKVYRQIVEQSRASRGQCIEWSGTLRKVYDLLVHGLSD